jgi:DNA topoisomerase-1
MPKSLVIVESPAKAKTLGKILGSDFLVESSMGHITDLPRKSLGVDIEEDFKPKYVVLKNKNKVISLLKKKAQEADKIYLATDPDREGEAISWHLKDRIGTNRKFLRVVFHEITKDAVLNAFRHPSDIDRNKVNAQTARRVLDRIVGYFLSPLLWKKVGTGMSAGRVQSVALRFIVDREREIQNFIPREYWEIEAELKKKIGRSKKHFIAKLDKFDNKKIEIANRKEAERIVEELENKNFIVQDISNRKVKKSPFAPFTTSSMQQDAFNKLGFNTNKTMIIAQQLYEGIEIGKEGPVGLITYMRTDSVRVSAGALKDVRSFISSEFGKEYIPERPNVYKSKRGAQEAHEAIRPTAVKRKPDDIKKFLSEEQYRLYRLIWQRFVSSQMASALYLLTNVKIAADKYLFSATGSELLFQGFTILYKESAELQQTKKSLPKLEKDEILDLVNLIPSQHFTKPPPRFSEASLVRALEEKGIGRPSTYAPIINTIVLRNYVFRAKGYFTPTELGMIINDLLIKYFPKIMDADFTAQLESKLDMVEEGRQNWITLLDDFYNPFKEWLKFAQDNIKKTFIITERNCPRCGKSLVIKWGRKGKFLSCAAFPDCRYSEAFSTGIKCPQEGCAGELVERRSRTGKTFLACNNYPKCRYTASLAKYRVELAKLTQNG